MTVVPAGILTRTWVTGVPISDFTQAGPALVNFALSVTVFRTRPVSRAPVTWKSAVFTAVTGTVAPSQSGCAGSPPPTGVVDGNSVSFTAGPVPGSVSLTPSEGAGS